MTKKLFLPSIVLRRAAANPPSTAIAVVSTPAAVTTAETESNRALTRRTLAAIERIDDRIGSIAESMRHNGDAVLSLIDQRLTQLEQAFEERVAMAESILLRAMEARLADKVANAPQPATPSPTEDLRVLTPVFVSESLDGVTDRAKKSTYKSAFEFWWAMWEPHEQGFPDEPAIERFGKRCRATASPDYAVSRQRVMRKWREWLIERGIEPCVDQVALLSAPATVLGLPAPSGGQASTDTRLSKSDLSDIANTVRDSLFGGEASEDHWAVVVRRVSSALGVRGIAEICGVDMDVAEKWVQLKRIPRHNREQLEHAWMLVLLKKAQTKHGKDVDDLWDDMITIEKFLSGTGASFDEV